MNIATISKYTDEFLKTYSPKEKDLIWEQHSEKFRIFWMEKIMPENPAPVSDVECDEIIRILDRNGKGNNKECEAVARAMVPQGAWRRMFKSFQNDKPLALLVDSILKEQNAAKKMSLIDKLYSNNKGKNNHLTGQSGNTISTFLAAFDPIHNLSVISLNDRKALLDFLNMALTPEWDKATPGAKVVKTNSLLLSAGKKISPDWSARTVTKFYYFPPVLACWKEQHTVKRIDKTIKVAIPEDPEKESSNGSEIRESLAMQARLAEIGSMMGFKIWLPKSDRKRVLKKWANTDGSLLDELPLHYDATTIKTIEQIDVIWLKKRAIVRAFEVEHTTSVYSGLLRMADLIALQPNMNIRLHIVAPSSRREKFFQEVSRPVFSLLEDRALSEIVSFLAYDSIHELSEQKHLGHLSDKVLDDYEEQTVETD